ncbi:nuclear transport factor 2 family protein [Rhodococcus sp. USK13]|uniref:nuclear transport factor 2 family protein n=1 Tax=Rhodococcus sp. USK13 TaxID=2806442 RepID=UPI001BD19A07|nr:nuclear transport factor 2 family protein [Rhodococcus sp. USK13]
MSETVEFLRDFGSRWADAWNSHDTDRVLELIHPDIRWDDTVFWPRIIEGRDELREYTDMIWKVMPDVEFEEVQFFTAPDDGRALFLFLQRATAPAKFDSDRRSETFGCDIFLGFKDGLLSSYLAQYELSEMMRQYGALPPRGERIGGQYLLSLLGQGDWRAEG